MEDTQKHVLSTHISEVGVNNQGKQLKKVIMNGKKIDEISKTPEYKRFKVLNEASKKLWFAKH